MASPDASLQNQAANQSGVNAEPVVPLVTTTLTLSNTGVSNVNGVASTAQPTVVDAQAALAVKGIASSSVTQTGVGVFSVVTTSDPTFMAPTAWTSTSSGATWNVQFITATVPLPESIQPAAQAAAAQAPNQPTVTATGGTVTTTPPATDYSPYILLGVGTILVGGIAWALLSRGKSR